MTVTEKDLINAIRKNKREPDLIFRKWDLKAIRIKALGLMASFKEQGQTVPSIVSLIAGFDPAHLLELPEEMEAVLHAREALEKNEKQN